jgi:hypothetical protein
MLFDTVMKLVYVVKDLVRVFDTVRKLVYVVKDLVRVVSICGEGFS